MGDAPSSSLEASRDQRAGDVPVSVLALHARCSANANVQGAAGDRKQTWARLISPFNIKKIHMVSLLCLLAEHFKQSQGQETTACLRGVVKAIIKLLLGADLQLAERGGQLLITNACFHTALLLCAKSLACQWIFRNFFPFFPSTVFPSMVRADLITTKSSLMLDTKSSLQFFQAAWLYPFIFPAFYL